jgi:2-dehydro-3-deoxygalactonokinase
MDTFLGCDWGTSLLRLRLANTTNLKIICEENTGQGIAATYTAWKESGGQSQPERKAFYLDILNNCIQRMENKLQQSLSHVPVIISGMASSSVGMMELPYQSLPFAVDGSGAAAHYIESTNDFPHPVLLISGVKGDNEVMRGEETQLVGCMDSVDKINDECIFIFPGTHSKHITVSQQNAVAIRTFMTGEFFALLSGKSILQTSVKKHDETESIAYAHSFSKGVASSVGANLLNVSFRIRTNELLHGMDLRENYSYLGGLLIGTELKELLQPGIKLVYICAGPTLATLYAKAISTLRPVASVHVLPPAAVDAATIRGQYKIFQHFKRVL